MGKALADLLKSKKALTAIATVIAAIVAKAAGKYRQRNLCRS